MLVIGRSVVADADSDPIDTFEVVESALHEVGAVEDGLHYLVDTFRVVG